MAFKLEDVATRLGAVPCPICGKTAYRIDPRGNEAFAETLYTASCIGCNYRFQVGYPTRPMEQHDLDTANWLSTLACPGCQKRGATLDFRCTPSVRQSLYLLTCRHCHRPFVENSPMTAYE